MTPDPARGWEAEALRVHVRTCTCHGAENPGEACPTHQAIFTLIEHAYTAGQSAGYTEGYRAGTAAECERIAQLADDLGQDMARHGRSGDAVKAALMKGGIAAYRSFAETLRALRAPERT